MPDLPKLPQSVAADKAWADLMHTLGKRVPRRLHRAQLARRQLRAMTRKGH